MTDKEQEFHLKRLAFYAHAHNGVYIISIAPNIKGSHKTWIPVESRYSMRGYFMDKFIHIYQNSDFSIPNSLTPNTFHNLFTTFPLAEEIRMGAYIGKVGDVFEPILVLKKEQFYKNYTF